VSGLYLYFAYGSNMLTARLRARTPSARPVATGWIDGRRLAFHKLGADGSGKCDIAPAPPDARVHGVLFEVARAEEPALDRVEGLGWGYRKDTIVVATADGDVEASTYLATRIRDGIRPFCWYHGFVVAGAEEHLLPDDYVAEIRATPFARDGNARRRTTNEAILFGR